MTRPYFLFLFAFSDAAKNSAVFEQIKSGLLLVESRRNFWRTLFKKRTFEKHRWTSKRALRLMFALCDAAVSWLATVVMLVFPVAMFFALALMPYCY